MKALSAIERAFRASLDATREQVSRNDEDPLGETATADIGKRTLDRILRDGDAEAAGILIGTIEDFAQEFAAVVRRFLKLDEWARTQRIVVGGGLRASRIGELAIVRAAVLLKAAGQTLDLQAIRSDLDEAGLIGRAHLAPRGVIRGCYAILAVDIGGSNIRVGTVEIEPGSYAPTGLTRSSAALRSPMGQSSSTAACSSFRPQAFLPWMIHASQELFVPSRAGSCRMDL